MGDEARSGSAPASVWRDARVWAAIVTAVGVVLAAVLPSVLSGGDDESDAPRPSDEPVAAPPATSAASDTTTSAPTTAVPPAGGEQQPDEDDNVTESSSTLLLEPGGNERYDVQAEDLALVDPMTVVEDPSAELGRFVETTESEQGTVTWQVQVDEAGEYIMWAHVRIPEGRVPTDANSFYVRVNDGEVDTWDLFEEDASAKAGTWQWEHVSVRCGGGQERHNCDPYVVELREGANEIVFEGREPFSQLDALILTNSEVLVP